MTSGIRITNIGWLRKSMDPVLIAVLATFAIALLAFVWWKRRPHGEAAGVPHSHALVPIEREEEMATSVVLGMSADKPAVVISMSSDEAAFAVSSPLSNGRLDLIDRMSATLQAVPSLLVQQAHQGRHLMEVVINNPLVNSAKGDYFLPFARGVDGRMIEQAKLLNPSGLSSLVNAAAVWQVASVVVAQKHLADISAKLDDIKQGIDDLKNLVQDKLDGDIEGTYNYLREVVTTFERGQVPKFARLELEGCRRQLLQIESALMRMFDRRLKEAVQHKETVGTGDLLQDTLRRYDDLDRIRGSLLTCLRTQTLAWHVLSLFPGEETPAEIWKEGTLATMGKLAGLQSSLSKTADQDVERFHAWFNRESTLEARRTEVQTRARQSTNAIEHETSAFQLSMDRTTLKLERNSDPIRLGLEVINGEIQQVRVLA